MSEVSIVGTLGVPGRYGGFETLAENLLPLPFEVSIFCSSMHYPNKIPRYKGASLRYLPLNANGPQSTVYDIVSLLLAGRSGTRVVLVLGVSGAIAFPLIRKLFPRMKILVNVDGIEWRRSKWGRVARLFLRYSEKIAVRHADSVISDNQGIYDHLLEQYGTSSTIISYGGDHAFGYSAPTADETYGLAICRIEPENNVHLILRAFASCGKRLIFIGNWDNSEYGRKLRAEYGSLPNIELLEPIYEIPRLASYRAGCAYYVHGHSAGGTNPSLIEMMFYPKPLIVFDCNFNRYTMDNLGYYFSDAESLISILNRDELTADPGIASLAKQRYTWESIRNQYVETLRSLLPGESSIG
jgi:glycosyltransferase involved in cell wall biosynthesis